MVWYSLVVGNNTVAGQFGTRVLPTLLLAGACCILAKAALAIMLLVRLARVTPRHGIGLN